MATLRFVERLRDLVDGVEVVLSDIWGVVHNGLESFRRPARGCAAIATRAHRHPHHQCAASGGSVAAATAQARGCRRHL